MQQAHDRFVGLFLATPITQGYVSRTMGDWPLTVLFDFDGVIVNSEPLHLLAFQEVLAAEHIELSQEEYFHELIGFDDKGAFKRIFELRKRPLEPKTFLRIMARKSQVMMNLIHRRNYHALPGVEEFVRGLWRNYPLAICSGGLREEIEAMLEGVSLRDCFNIIVAAEDVTVGKPDPQGYLLAMQLVSEKLRHPLKPADCLIIEDAPTVIHSIKKEGFPVLGLTTSFSSEKLDRADWIANSLRTEEVTAKIPQLRFGP